LEDIVIKHKFSQLKGKGFPVHIMKAYRGSKGVAPPFLTWTQYGGHFKMHL